MLTRLVHAVRELRAFGWLLRIPVFGIGTLALMAAGPLSASAQATSTRPVVVKRVDTAWTVQANGGIGVDRDGLIYVATSGQIYRFGPTVSDYATVAGQNQSLPTVRGLFVTPAGLILWTGGNHTVNRITPAGTATVVAGANFQSGYADGPAATARFNNPAGVVGDAAGNLYVADSNNHVIRRIAVDGTVSTIAGRAGQGASIDGAGDTARFNFPQKLAIDADGNLYVSEQGRYSVRRITPAGEVTTFAGHSVQAGTADGVGGAARFNFIAGLAVDAGGAVWVFDGSRTLRRVAPDGTVTTVAGTANQSAEDRDGAGASVRFTSPQAIAVAPDGTLLLGDNWYVRRATPDGIPVAPVIATQPASVTAALGGSVTLTVEAYGTPAPSFSWRKNGNIVTGAAGPTLTLNNVASGDAGDYTVVVTNSQGTVASAVATLTLVPAPVNDHFAARTTLTGAPVSVVAGFVGATRETGEPAHNGAGAHGGSLWWSWTAPATGFVTLDLTGANWIGKIYTGSAVGALVSIDPAGAYSGGNSASRFTFHAVGGTTYQIAVERAVGASENEGRFTLAYAFTVQPFVGDSSSVNATGSEDGTGAAARFSGAYGIVRDSSGNYFVADAFNHTIRKITPAGVVTTFAGAAGQSGTATGTGSAARFNMPQGLAIDASNNLYVADAQNHAIRKITPAGVVSNFAGLPGTSGMTNASGTSARFNFPRSVAVDASGNVYVADTNNYVIRRITTAGAVSTFVGTAGSADAIDGTGTAAKFYVPQSLTLRGTTLYVGEGTTAARLRVVNTANAAVTTLNYSPNFGVTPVGMTTDSSGHIYFTSDYALTRVSPDGVATRVAGGGYTQSYVDGDAYQARFQSSFGVMPESDGSLLFTANGTVRRATITTQAAAPVIFMQPASRAVAAGTGVTLSVTAFGGPNVNFQWHKNGQPIAGGASGSLTFSSAAVADSGTYTVTASNASGTVTSDAAELTVVAVPANDSFTGAPALSGAAVNATGYNFGASRETGEPVLHGQAAGRTVWWKWTAPLDGMIVADTAGSALPLTYVAAFTGPNVASLTPIGATGVAPGNGDAARVYVPVSAGVTYHFAVDASGNNNSPSEGLVRLNINYAHTVVTLAGAAGQSGVVDETGLAARFSSPVAMARDANGNLYVGESSGRVVRKITPAGVVTTLAGTAFTSGTADGTGADARFSALAGMAIDPGGNLYVTDSSAHTIRKITPAGGVTTLAGLAAADGGGAGAVDGTGSAARFNSPRGIVYGSDGALYVADLSNRVIRRVTLTGVVTTFAGTAGQSGTTDGTGADARFNSPLAIASAPDGNLYVGDSVTVRRLTVPGAVLTTIAGSFNSAMRLDHFGTAARFTSISSLGADAAGNLYVADQSSRFLRKLSPNGHVATIAGSGSTGANSGSGPAASFSSPTGVSVAADGTVFFTDQSQHLIRRAAPSHLPQAPLITGTPASQTVLAGERVTLTIDVTAAPTAQAVWRRDGSVLADVTGYSLVLASAQPSDSGSYQVDFTNASGSAATGMFTLTVLPAASNDLFANRAALTGPRAAVVTNNFLTTAEPGEPAHFEGGAGRSAWWTWTAPHDGPVILDTFVSEIATLMSVYTGSAVDALTRVADGQNVVRFQARAGTTYQIAVDGRAGATGGFTLNLAYAYGARTVGSGSSPRQFARAANGTIYFTDLNRTVCRLEPNGEVTVIAGAPNLIGSTDGVGTAARFGGPDGLAVADDGTLYVADMTNHTLRRIATDGTVTTIAGLAGSPGSANGTGADARFNSPMGLALDAAGENLYIADYANYVIRRLQLSTGAVTYFAGFPGARATASVHNGTGTGARFYNPAALTFGGDGNLYVADQGIALIRRITPAGVVTTLTGTALAPGMVDGPLATARLQNVTSIAFDPAGHLVILDQHALRTVTLAGSVLTVTGSISESGNRDGAGEVARFTFPRGLAIAADGAGWFASSNRLIRLEAPGAVFPPVITTQPQSASGFVGGAVTLTVTAIGTPAGFTYQWFRDNTPLAGATDASLALDNLQLAAAGAYRVDVSNAGGTVSSVTATVTVATRPANDSFANAIVLTGNAPAATLGNVGATREAGEPQHANNPGGSSLWWKWTAPASGAVIADAAGSSIDPIIAVYTGTTLANLVEQGSAAPTPPVQYAPPPRPPAVMFTAVEGTTYWIAMDGDFGATGTLVLHLSFTYNFTTMAGLPGTSGNVNGTGTAARFSRLNATVPDAQGNIYVADLNNHAIRKVTAAGAVTTVAGPTGSTGVSGYVNSTTASSVRFSSPAGIVLAADGFLYVADAGNHAIRKVNPTNGTTTTFAGPTTAASGTADGTTTAARFNNPAAIVLDNAGNFIVADATNHAIRKITPAGVVTTVAGLKGTSGAVNAIGTNARFNTPEGVAIDAAGNIYVADFRNHAVRRIASNGDVTTIAGQLNVDPNFPTAGYVDGPIATSKLSGPNGVTALADGSVLIADYYNSALRILTTDGYVLTLAGGNGAGHADGTGLGIKFNQPATISVDQQGRIYIADQSNHVVRRGIITSAPSAPDISRQPQGTRIIAGSSVTLTASAIGNPFPTYQWRKNGVAIAGATSGTLTLADAQPSDSGSYTLVATNAHGSATTEAAVIEILPLSTNDSFAARSRLVGDAIGVSAYNFRASAQPGEPAHGGSGAPASKSVWFTWTAPTTGDVTVDTIGSRFDTRLSIYRGETLATLTPWSAATAEPGKRFAKVRFAVNAGDVFQIAVDGVDGAEGDFRLTIDYSWNFALYAGALNTSGNGGTTLSTARFNFPAAMARDNSGNLYLADTENHTIRRITAAGVVSVLAGSAGVSGTATGTGTAARFNRPYGVAVDSAGNIYVADTNNHAIRKITSAGAVSNFAGLPGTSGSVDGTGTAARFNNPANLALDAAGNVYVTDYSNALVRKITPAGVVTTFAGTLNTFGNDPKYFNVPWGIAVDSSGNVYVGDRADIRKITPDGVAAYFAGNVNSSDGSADGLGTAAEFNYPAQISIDGAGNLYVADRMNSLIRKVSPNGEVRTIGGRPAVHGYLDGTADVAVFAYPMGLFVDAGGYMYVGDTGTFLVRLGSRQAGTRAPAIVTQPENQSVPSGGTASFTVVASGFPAPTYQWRRNGVNIAGATSPALAVANVTQAGSYDVVVTNVINGVTNTVTSRAAALSIASEPSNNHFANALALTGSSVTASAFPSAATAETNEPAHAGAPAARSLWWSWTAPANGVVVAQTAGSAIDTRLAVYTGSALNALTLLAENDDALAGGGSRVQFLATAGVTYRFAVDVNVTAAANFGGVRLGVDYAYVVSTFAGSPGNAGTANGNGPAARFTSPASIARDSLGNFYVAEPLQHVIRRIASDGTVSVFAGAAGQSGAVNGNGAAARFNLPYGLAIDAGNNVYVADYGNRVIRRITPAGDVTTFAGAFNQGGATDGALATARFNLIYGLAFDAAGALYATDLGNHNVRKISAGNVSTLAGSAGATGSLDGTTTAARFNEPRGLAADSQGNLYVADFANHTVRRITAAGVVTTLAGFAGSHGVTDGVGSNARFTGPFALAVDPQDRLYVTDASHRVRVVSSIDGLVTTAAGGTEGAAEGLALAAQFDVPIAIVAAPNGVLYVTDYDNHTIRALTPSSQAAVAQSIDFAPLLDRAFTPNPITLSATATSGLAVTFTIIAGEASVAGNQLTLLGTGAVTVRASQAGNASWLAATPVDRTFNVTASFSSWLIDHNFTSAELENVNLTGPNADYDKDGIANLVEYALGLNPKAASTSGLPEITRTSTEWTFTYTRPAARSDVRYFVQCSSNLTAWTDVTTTHTLVSAGNGVETWRATVPTSGNANCFFRLRVER